MPDVLGALTLDAYLEQLASRAPAPGGGAAVALTGAQAAALLAMVVRVGGEPDLQGGPLLGHLDRLRRRFLELADDDARAFSAVIAAYRLPKATDAAKAARAAAVQAALKGAAEVPLAVIAEVAELFAFAEDVVAGAKPTVASDAGIALELMSASLKAARYNVDINLKHIRDDHYNQAKAELMATLLAGKKAWRRRLKERVRAVLGA